MEIFQAMTRRSYLALLREELSRPGGMGGAIQRFWVWYMHELYLSKNPCTPDFVVIRFGGKKTP